MNRTAKALVLNEEIINSIFLITRATDIRHEEKVIRLAKIVATNGLEFKPLVEEIIGRDRTGYKEVIGHFTKLTGFGLREICTDPYHYSQLEAFSKKEPCARTQKEWGDALKSSLNEPSHVVV